MSDFFITTAIDYTNAPPHIGHAYEKILADVIARYHRLKGDDVFLLSGVDQHGQKVQQSAEKQGVAPQEFVDGYHCEVHGIVGEARCAIRWLGCDDGLAPQDVRPKDSATVVGREGSCDRRESLDLQGRAVRLLQRAAGAIPH
jgi:hypothetical protein